jgi:hypothetical protein
VLARTSATPDQVTLSSGFGAIAGSVSIGAASEGDPWLLRIGAGLFFLSIVLDCADGQLARLRGVSSFAGRALDGYVDVVSTGAVFWGMGIFMMRHGLNPAYVIPVGFVAGFSMKWQVHTYDHVKNIYLHNTVPRSEADRAPAFPTYEEITAERDEHLRSGRWFHALLCAGFIHLTRSQRKGEVGRAGLDNPAMSTPGERALYRSTFRQHMRIWTFNGLGTHLFLVVIAILVIPANTSAPLYLWWFMIIPLNLLTAFLVHREKGLEERVRRSLARQAA